MCDVYIYILVTAFVCACVPVERASLHRELHTHTHIYTKQPAYGRHRKTYFPLKTYNAGVRQCMVCCVVWQR